MSAEQLLGQPLLRELARLPGWSIQVVSGHLIVWHGLYSSMDRSTLPRSGERMTDLVRFAALVHRMLSRQAKSAAERCS
jgi:hypothetical protein